MSIGCERKLLCDLLLLFCFYFLFFIIWCFFVFSSIHQFFRSLLPSRSCYLFSKMSTFVGFSRKVKAPLKWRLKFSQCMRILITVMNCNWVYLFWVAVIIQITWKQSKSINLSDIHDKNEREKNIHNGMRVYAPHHHLPLIVVLFLFCCSAFFHRSSSACLRVERASPHRFQFGCKCLRIDNVWELSNYNWLNRFYHHT